MSADGSLDDAVNDLNREIEGLQAELSRNHWERLVARWWYVLDALEVEDGR